MYIFGLFKSLTDDRIHTMCDIKSVALIYESVQLFIFIYYSFLKVYMTNTFENNVQRFLVMHTGTHPGMIYHIKNHIKRKTEVTIQHNDTTPCDLAKD